MFRLDHVSLDLGQRLLFASPAKLRAAMLVAIEYAISSAGVEHPLVDAGLQELRSTGRISSERKAELGILTAQLDEEYFDRQDACDEGRATRSDWMRLFQKARAVMALSEAGNDDALLAAAESIYEAAAAVDDQSVLFARIESALT